MFIGVANLDGVALQWYERLDDDDEPDSWDEFAEKLLKQFGIIDEERVARDNLMTLRQTGTVE